MSRLAVILATLLFSAACSSGESDVPPPPTQGMQLAVGPFSVPSGKEDYYCYSKKLTAADVGWIVRFEPFNSPSVHHVAVFQVFGKEPEGFYPCPALTKQTWVPLYSGGRNTNGISLPEGAGSQIAADDQLLVHVHLLNASPSEVTERLYMNLHYAEKGADLTPAGIFALGTQRVHIPDGARDFKLTKECMAPKPLNVFAVFPHMHKYATRFQVEHGPTSPADASVVYKLDPWNFGDQPMDPLKLNVKTGDFLRVTCAFNNTSGHELTYGESADNEMCYGILFYTPFDQLDGCVEF